MALDNPAVKTSPDLTAPSFSIVSKEITVEPADSEGRRRFHLTASSTIEDMAGDEIEVAALQKAAAKFRDGVTIFMDHDYKHVGSAFGLTDTAEVIQRGLDEKSGKPIWDLDIHGVVNTPNPTAKQLADSIDGKYVKLGASLTAFIRKHSRKTNGGMLIKDMDVVEASVVGVAENQRSWAHKAALAVKSFHKPEWLHEDEEEAVSKDADLEEAAEPTTEPEAIEASEEHETTTTVETTETTTETAETDEVVEKSADICPGCGKGRDAEGCDDGYHAKEKSLADSTLGVQESDSETPETTPTDETTEADTLSEKALGGSPEDVAALVRHATGLVEEIGRLRSKNAALAEENATLKQANLAVSKEVDLATEAIQKVMDMPLRSSTAGYVEDFTTAHTLFDPQIADYLNKRSKLNV